MFRTECSALNVPHRNKRHDNEIFAAAQAVCSRPVTKEGWVRSQVSLCVISAAQSDTGTYFSASNPAVSYQYQSVCQLSVSIRLSAISINPSVSYQHSDNLL
jgi:hypothetical protein